MITRPYLFSLASKPFPSFGVKNIALYYFISVFSTAWFIVGNWLFFALKYISPYGMSILEAVSFGIGLVLEIPSGAFADLWGKKRSIQIGLGMQLLGSIMFVMADLSTWLLIVGNIIIISAFAFISGSMEALAYDSLVESGQEDKYDIIVGRLGTLIPITFVITALLGGMMWSVNHYLPWMATIIAFALAFLASFGLKEPAVDTDKFSFVRFIEQNKIGFSQLLIPEIRKYLYVFVSVLATYYMWSTGIIRILMGESFGYDGETLSYLISIVFLISAVLTFYFDSIKRLIGNGKGLFLLTVLSFLAWFLAGIGGGILVGALVFLLLTVAGQLHRPWTSSIINKHVPSKYRATTISTLQFFVQVPYVIVVIFFGKLIELEVEHIFYFLVSTFLLLSLFMSYGHKLREKKMRYTGRLQKNDI